MKRKRAKKSPAQLAASKRNFTIRRLLAFRASAPQILPHDYLVVRSIIDRELERMRNETTRTSSGSNAGFDNVRVR